MRTTIGYILPLLWICGCSENSSDAQASNEATSTPYRLGQALVIGTTEGGQLVNVDESCDTAACEAVRERCGDRAYADVVVDADGNVLDVLCFRGNATVREIGEDTVATASAGNNTVLLFDGEDDGADVTGDVVLTGNNAVVYGRGADVSEIGGNLAIDKNNAVVRGATIRGDVSIDKNNAQLSFTEIFGGLTIDGNNTTLAECIVHGQVQIHGVNTVLVQNRFEGARALSGKNLTCNGNVSFESTDEGAAEAGSSESGSADAGASDAGTLPVPCQRTNGRP
jgi:hypothetical protein